MTTPAVPGNTLAPVGGQVSRRVAWALALVLSLGAIAVVLAVVPSPLFDLDRFGVPKELALHLTALLGAVITLLTITRLELRASDLLLVGYLGWSAASAVAADNHWLATRALAVTVSGGAVHWIARQGARGGTGRGLAAGLALAVVLGGLTGEAQAYGWETNLLADTRAPGGTFGNRNFMAHLMTIGLPLILWLLLAARRAAGAAVAALGLGLLSGAVVLSRSRAAWVGVAAALGVMALGGVIAGARRGGDASVVPRGRVRLAAGAAALGVVLALVLPNRLEWRSRSPYSDTLRGVLNYREGSGRGRLVQYRNTLGLVARDPVFGVGPGNWPVAYPLVTTPGDPSFHAGDAMPMNPWPSSDWVAVLAERGPAGLALLAAFFGGLALTAFRRLRADDPAVALQSLAGLGVLVAAAVVGMFDVVLHLAPPILITFAALGVLIPETRPWRSLGLKPARRRRLVLAAALVGVLASLRSAGQLGAILRAGYGTRLADLEAATALDPGSYRLHLLLAVRAPCPGALVHARAAAGLFPHLPAAHHQFGRCLAWPTR